MKVLVIYNHGGHLGHVTWTIYTNFRSPILGMLYMKFGFDCIGQAVSEEKMLEKCGQRQRRSMGILQAHL